MAQGYLSPAFQNFLIDGEPHDRMLSLSIIPQVQGLNLSSALKHRSAIGLEHFGLFWPEFLPHVNSRPLMLYTDISLFKQSL